MIIFDLDGTLANCEHRQHFVDPSCNPNYKLRDFANLEECIENMYIKKEYIRIDSSKEDILNGKYETFKPDWRAFFEACGNDEPILSSLGILRMLHFCNAPIEIWSGRCESVRWETEHWMFVKGFPLDIKLRMRPIGDNTPDDQLKEKWLNERCADLMEAQIEKRMPVKHDIDYVFDDRPKVVRMWRRRGIFVFDCSQTGKEF